MKRPAGISAASYARRIERIWSGKLDRPIVLSPRDWEIANDWHERGIPLEIVEEQMNAAVERARRRGRSARSALSFLRPGVDDAWSTVVGGRLDETAPPAPAPASRGAAAAWREAAAAAGEDSPLASLLERLLAELEGGAEPGEVDRELDLQLPEAAPAALRREVEAGVERDLAPHRGRMPPGEIERSGRAALRRFLRERLGLPRLAPSEARR